MAVCAGEFRVGTEMLLAGPVFVQATAGGRLFAPAINQNNFRSLFFGNFSSPLR